MSIHIRELTTLADFALAEGFQRDEWGMPVQSVVPDHVLLTAQKNGGIVLGAFATGGAADGGDGPMIAYLFSFIGREADGQFKHCSHQLAVAPAYRGQGIGTRMKLYQRELALAQGIKLMTWTFDPLERRNALMNIHLLGGISATYLPNLYGPMQNGLPMALPSDRLLVRWELDHARVLQRIASIHARRPMAQLVQQYRMAGAVLLNPPETDPSGGLLPRPCATSLAPQATTLLVAIPAQMRRIREQDHELALAWRLHIRAVLGGACAAGYTITDMLADGEIGYYVLQQDGTRE